MDVFIEQIVAKKSEGREIMLKIGVVTAGVSLTVFMLIISYILFTLQLMSFILLVVIAVGVVYLTNWIYKGINVEYEYILTNRDLDIDRISGKRKRKRLVTLNLLNADGFARYREGAGAGSTVTVAAHDGTYTDMWYLTAKHSAFGKVLLLFSPDEDFIIEINNALPGSARNKEVTDAARKRKEQEAELIENDDEHGDV